MPSILTEAKRSRGFSKRSLRGLNILEHGQHEEEGSSDSDSDGGFSPTDRTPAPVATTTVTLTQASNSLPDSVITPNSPQTYTGSSITAVGTTAPTSTPSQTIASSITSILPSTAPISPSTTPIFPSTAPIFPFDSDLSKLSPGSIAAIGVACSLVIFAIILLFLLRRYPGIYRYIRYIGWSRRYSFVTDPTISSFAPKEYTGSSICLCQERPKSQQSLFTLPSFRLTLRSVSRRASPLPPFSPFNRPTNSSFTQAYESEKYSSDFLWLPAPASAQFDSRSRTIRRSNYSHTSRHSVDPFGGGFVTLVGQDVPHSVGHTVETPRSTYNLRVPSSELLLPSRSSSTFTVPSLRVNSPVPPLPSYQPSGTVDWT